jgi:hypothetical protein
LFSIDTKLLFITVFTLDKNNNVIITIYGKTELINQKISLISDNNND